MHHHVQYCEPKMREAKVDMSNRYCTGRSVLINVPPLLTHTSLGYILCGPRTPSSLPVLFASVPLPSHQRVSAFLNS